jgi:hypothetical protein
MQELRIPFQFRVGNGSGSVNLSDVVLWFHVKRRTVTAPKGSIPDQRFFSNYPVSGQERFLIICVPDSGYPVGSSFLNGLFDDISIIR